MLNHHELINQIVEGVFVEVEFALQAVERHAAMLAQVGLRPHHRVEEAHDEVPTRARQF